MGVRRSHGRPERDYLPRLRDSETEDLARVAVGSVAAVSFLTLLFSITCQFSVSHAARGEFVARLLIIARPLQNPLDRRILRQYRHRLPPRRRELPTQQSQPIQRRLGRFCKPLALASYGDRWRGGVFEKSEVAVYIYREGGCLEIGECF